jgi:hypothetical protein
MNAMTGNCLMRGEKIIELDLDITDVTDYGVSLDAILSDNKKIPPQGVRFDVAFDGRSSGRLSGRVHGVDYIWAHADWRIDLISGPPSKRRAVTGLLYLVMA